jgi:hypothetical protein
LPSPAHGSGTPYASAGRPHLARSATENVHPCNGCLVPESLHHGS